ncbi:MAG: hypothetical protein HOW73_40985 [Polyangiaceae bacterium]|nr:hypothetical protein [Polyangiaceae bacterium]
MKSMTALFSLALAGLVAGACGDDTETGGTGAGGGGGGAGGGGTGGAGGAAPSVEVVTAFDADAFELPEGLAIRDGDAYLGFALTGAIDRFELPSGARSAFANAPPPPPNTSFLTGLTFDPAGNLYGAYVSFTADAAPGIYRAPAAGGEATLWATHPQMVFPNGFAWDDDGRLYVTDSSVGGVFRIDADGEVELWASDPLLEGDLEACGPHGDLAVGANGLVFKDGAFYVASSDKALLARIPLEADGGAGVLNVVGEANCDELAGIDGMTLDDDGTIIAAINRSNRIVRIGEDGAVEVLAEGAPLEFPASVELAGEGDERALYVTSFALGALLAGEEPHPALVRIVF